MNDFIHESYFSIIIIYMSRKVNLFQLTSAPSSKRQNILNFHPLNAILNNKVHTVH